MSNAIKMGQLAVEDMSAKEAETFLKWLQKKVTVRVKDEAPPVLDSAARWWLKKLKSGNVVPDAGWPTTLLIEDLGDDYIRAMKRNHLSRRGNVTAMGRFLEKLGAVEKKRSSIKDPATNHRRRHYAFHDLGVCRVAFEAKYGPQDWTPVDDAQKGEGQCPNGE